MRATAPDRLLLGASQAIGKHLRDRGDSAGVAPECMAKRNSELIGIGAGAPTTLSVSRLANTRSLGRRATSLALVFARVLPPRGA